LTTLYIVYYKIRYHKIDSHPEKRHFTPKGKVVFTTDNHSRED
jgi:hypothetical protein